MCGIPHNWDGLSVTEPASNATIATPTTGEQHGSELSIAEEDTHGERDGAPEDDDGYPQPHFVEITTWWWKRQQGNKQRQSHARGHEDDKVTPTGAGQQETTRLPKSDCKERREQNWVSQVGSPSRRRPAHAQRVPELPG